LKIAVTLLAWVMVTRHVPVPLQAPVQPVKAERYPGVAVRVTSEPYPKLALHVLPQLMPLGLLVTVPVPVPDFETVKLNIWSVKIAVTSRAWVIVTLQVPVPVQAPLQPAKVEPVAGVAVRVTGVP
jgi:hypothetical protein